MSKISGDRLSRFQSDSLEGFKIIPGKDQKKELSAIRKKYKQAKHRKSS